VAFDFYQVFSHLKSLLEPGPDTFWDFVWPNNDRLQSTIRFVNPLGPTGEAELLGQLGLGGDFTSLFVDSGGVLCHTVTIGRVDPSHLSFHVPKIELGGIDRAEPALRLGLGRP
jgi:hypothetical protein